MRLSSVYNNMLWLWAVLFLTILPVFWWPGIVPFEAPKADFILIAWGMGLIALLFTLKAKTVHWHANPLWWPVTVYVLWSGVSAYLGVDLAKSVAGNFYRADGLLVLLGVVGASLTVSLVWRRVGFERMAGAIVGGAVLVSVWAVAEFSLSGTFEGVGASFGNPVLLGGYLACVLPVARYLARVVGGWWKVAVWMVVAGIGVTFSWGSWLVVGGVWAVEWWLERKYLKAGLIALVAVAGLVVVVWAAQARGFVAEGRDRIYPAMIVGYCLRPWGYGIANADYAFEAGVAGQGIGHDVLVDKAHNLILEELVTKGVVGVLLWFWIVWAAARQWWRRGAAEERGWSRAWGLVMLSYLLIGMVNVTSVATELLFWLTVWLAREVKG